MLGSHGEKFYGNFMFDNRWEVMNKAVTFPGDVWKLAEERTVEPIAWLDQVHEEDPEGSNITFELDEKQAQAWAKGAYQQGHLYMFPHHATGRFPYSIVEYPALSKDYNPRYLLKVNGVFAGESNQVFSQDRGSRQGWLCEGGKRRWNIWGTLARISQVSED